MSTSFRRPWYSCSMIGLPVTCESKFSTCALSSSVCTFLSPSLRSSLRSMSFFMSWYEAILRGFSPSSSLTRVTGAWLRWSLNSATDTSINWSVLSWFATCNVALPFSSTSLTVICLPTLASVSSVASVDASWNTSPTWNSVMTGMLSVRSRSALRLALIKLTCSSSISC